MIAFKDKYTFSRKNKENVLCIGLDPAIPGQRSINVIPERYLQYPDENEAKLNFCLDIIDETRNFCCAYKPNQQYISTFTKRQHQKLTTAINEAGVISILDYKLNDIGDTIKSALFFIHQWGYDAVTFSPFLGNMEMAVDIAHTYKPAIGIIVLVLTSNPEAVKYQKYATINGKPLYIAIARDVKRFNADGCVVGATEHVNEEDIKRIRTIVGNDKVFLFPGVGVQKGDPEKVIRGAGENILVNVGRDIIYSSNPRKKAEAYSKMFSKLLVYA